MLLKNPKLKQNAIINFFYLINDISSPNPTSYTDVLNIRHCLRLW
jgi:hypothetical protein